MYVDATEYLADRIFTKQEIKVDFGKEYAKEGCKYLCIFCKVRKKDEDKFLEALEKLKSTMLLCGYEDYIEFCTGIFE